MKAAGLGEEILRDIEAMREETIALIRALCAIPAPSRREERRAAFIAEWFAARGMHARIDEAKNVLLEMGPPDCADVVIVAAHTDTVFPDMEPMPLREEGGRLYCPGVGDDTTNLAAMMRLAAYLHEKEFRPSCLVVFAANACEEGLGNLDGTRAIMDAYGPRVRAFLSLDGQTTSICSRAVGSMRYRVTARTRGGHSFADFGGRNAIAVLSGIVCALYAQRVPEFGGATTTYNVGRIEGGTSVNAIAQQASMLYEYRSDDAAALAEMEEQFRAILGACVPEDARLEIELLGQRPCGGHTDPDAQHALETACFDALSRYAGTVPSLCSGSTDCNIPLSMGVPSACFGIYRGDGAHTREEWVELGSIADGMKAAMSVLLGWFE